MLSDLFIRTFNFYLIFRTKFRTKCLTFWSHFCQLLHLRNNYSFCENFSECKLQVSFVARLDEMAAPKSPECLAIPSKRHQDVWQYFKNGTKMSATTKENFSKIFGSTSTRETFPRCLQIQRCLEIPRSLAVPRCLALPRCLAVQWKQYQDV